MQDILDEIFTRVELLLAGVGPVCKGLLFNGETLLPILVAVDESLLDTGEMLEVLNLSVLDLKLEAGLVVVFAQLILAVVDLLQVSLLLVDSLIQLGQLLRQVVVLLLHLSLLLPHSVKLLGFLLDLSLDDLDLIVDRFLLVIELLEKGAELAKTLSVGDLFL